MPAPPLLQPAAAPALAAQLAQFEETGYCVVPAALSPEEITLLRAAIDNDLAAYPQHWAIKGTVASTAPATKPHVSAGLQFHSRSRRPKLVCCLRTTMT